MAAVSIRNSTLFADANLVSYWEMEGNSNDSKGSNNGSDTNITYNTGNGKFLQGAGFVRASPSRITLADAASLKPTGNFTIFGWFKSSTTPGNQIIFASQSGNPFLAGFFIWVNASQQVQFFSGKNTGTTQGVDYEFATSVGATLCDGNWHMLVGVYNGTTLSTYIDGSLNGQTSWTIAATYAATNYPLIGDVNNTGTPAGQLVDGALDDISLFSRALTPTEITNHFSGADALPSGGMFMFF